MEGMGSRLRDQILYNKVLKQVTATLWVMKNVKYLLLLTVTIVTFDTYGLENETGS